MGRTKESVDHLQWLFSDINKANFSCEVLIPTLLIILCRSGVVNATSWTWWGNNSMLRLLFIYFFLRLISDMLICNLGLEWCIWSNISEVLGFGHRLSQAKGRLNSCSSFKGSLYLFINNKYYLPLMDSFGRENNLNVLLIVIFCRCFWMMGRLRGSSWLIKQV